MDDGDGKAGTFFIGECSSDIFFRKVWSMLHPGRWGHSHKKRKDSLETWAVFS